MAGRKMSISGFGKLDVCFTKFCLAFALTKKREPTILNGKAVKGTSKNRRNAQKAAGR